jgi:antitoxin (DNA-binding transcriptional repressor) of toxin-antitoxin stability system
MPEVVASQMSVRDLRTHLSEWLGRVQAGEVAGVTSHRRRIARLTAINQPDSTAANPLQKAIDAGIVSWNGQKPLFPPPVNSADAVEVGRFHGQGSPSRRLANACSSVRWSTA